MDIENGILNLQTSQNSPKTASFFGQAGVL